MNYKFKTLGKKILDHLVLVAERFSTTNVVTENFRLSMRWISLVNKDKVSSRKDTQRSLGPFLLFFLVLLSRRDGVAHEIWKNRYSMRYYK